MAEEEEEQRAPDGAPAIRDDFSRSVRDVGDELGWGEVTSWQIVHVLLRDHGHYGGSSLLPLKDNTGTVQAMDIWLWQVADHFDIAAVRASDRQVIDGRMTILGLTRLDPYLASALEEAGLRQRLEDDLGPELQLLLKRGEGDDDRRDDLAVEIVPLLILRGHERSVDSVALGQLGERELIVSGGADRTVRVWAAGGAPLQTLIGHERAVDSVALGQLGERELIISGGDDGTIRVWAADGAPLQTLTGHEAPVWSVALGRIGERDVIVSGGDDGTVRVWAADGASLQTLTGHEQRVMSVALGRLGEREVIVSASEDRTIQVWAADGAPLQTLTGHEAPVWSVALGRLGEREVIVSGGGDGTVRVWAEDGAPLQTLTGHEPGLMSVALGRLGEREVIVSGGGDGTVRVWAEDGAPLQTLTGHEHGVMSVALGRLGEREVIASGGADGTVRVWATPEVSAPATTDDQQDAIELVGDRAASRDELGRAPIAHDLGRRLARIHHDDPDHRGSFLVHLDGPWGAGKSSILNFLRDDLEAREPPWLVVDFNAWRERRARPPWWALITSLRAAVQADLGWAARQRLRVAETRERLSARGAAYGLGTLLFGLAVIGLVIAWVVGLVPHDLGVIAGLVTGLAGLIGLAWGFSQLAGRFVFWDSARRARAFEQTEEQPMQALAQHFAWLIDVVASRRFERLPGARDPSGSRPTIFFIDDLDRCEAEHVVELLEAVQNLIRDAGSSRGPYFVVAADGRWIRRSYESWFERFGETVAEPGRPLGYLFLDKLFQMSVQVPALTGGDQDGFMGRLLGVEAEAIAPPDTRAQEPPSKEEVLGRVERGGTEEDFTTAVAMAEALPAADRQEVVARVVQREAEPAQARLTTHRLQPYARHLPPNPRTMKRFVNAYEIARAVDRVEGRAVTPEQRAIWTVLRLRWPMLADRLQREPDLLDDLAKVDPADQDATVRLLAVGDVLRLVGEAEGAPFTAADLRACCGLEEPAPRVPTPA